MPTLVAAAIVEWLPAVAAALGTTGVTVLSTAIVLGAAYAYGSWQAAQAKRAARDNFNANLKDRLVMTATTDAPRSRVYGQARNVEGIMFKATHGDKSQFYTLVVAVAGHEIDGFVSFYFGDAALTVDSDGWVQTAPWLVPKQNTADADPASTAASGSFTLTLPTGATLVPSSVVVVADDSAASPQDRIDVTLPSSVSGLAVSWSGNADGKPVRISYQFTTGVPKARLRGYTGAPGQDLSGDLLAAGVPSGYAVGSKFEGIACILATLEYDTDAFVAGVPQISAVVRGAKVFDPRTSTTAWSDNPALIARDWCTYEFGGAADPSEIDDALIINAANACDVVHVFVHASGPSNTQKIYVCGIVCPTQTDPTSSLNEIVASMAGKYAWGGGILRIKAGAYAAPVVSIDDSWLSGQGTIDIQAAPSRLDLVNIYRPSIADQANGYVVKPTAEVRADAYVTADGQELPRDVTYLGITDEDHASHVSGVLMRDARSGLTVKLPCNFKAYPLELFDTVAVTLSRYGWAAKEFEVISYSFSPSTGVMLALKETAAALFDPDAVFNTSDDTPNSNLPLPWLVLAPTGVTIASGTSQLVDGSILTRTVVSWLYTDSAAVSQSGSFEVQYRLVVDVSTLDDWPSLSADGSARQLVITGLQSGRAYLVRVRGVNSLGVRSPWSLQQVHVVAQPPAISVDWTNLAGRPLLFRVTAQGFSDTSSPIGAGLRNGESGASLDGGITNRSYMLARIRRSDGVVTFARQYDVYGAGAIGGHTAADLAADLNASGTDVIVVVWTYDEPAGNRLTSGLDAAMYRCGASRAIFGKPNFTGRSAYVLIGIGGCGEGNGFEGYCDGVQVPTREFVDVAFMLKGGNLIVTGTASVPGQLVDYGYVGTLDATTDLALIARGNCVVAGNYGSKLGGSVAWDSDIYSRDAYVGGCYASAIADSITAGSAMFGLNSDPLTDQSYTSLDYAIYFASAALYLFESGANVLGPISIAVGAVGTVAYDGANIVYTLNGSVLRTVPTTAGRMFFFDSSFNDPGVALRNIRFGPMSQVSGIQTGQLVANAATDVYSDEHDFAGGAFGSGVARSFTVTPAVDSVIELTGKIVADNVYPDAGNNLAWYVTPAGGSATVVGDCDTNISLNKQPYTFATAFAAVASVTLTFELRVHVSSGNPAEHLFASSLRVTTIKR